MKLATGMFGKSLGWESLLTQEGIAYERIQDPGSGKDYSVVLLCDTAGSAEIESARNYLAGGGALVCSAKKFSQLSGVPSTRKIIRYLLPDAEGELSRGPFIDLFTECDIPDGANFLRTENGQPALFFGEYAGGVVAVLPFDAGAMVEDHRVAAKSFYAGRSRLPHEKVSLVSKGAIRLLVSRLFELLCHRRDLPFVHRWYYPRDAQSIFVLRIDADFGAPPAIESLLRLAAETDVPYTWFLHVSHQERFLEMFRGMRNHEIGVHCYRHIRYRDETAATGDLQQAVNVLAAADIHPAGFAAPYGLWNEQLAAAIDRFGFEYSSEFSYDYDNLPSFPVAGSPLKTLQLPVHPVSIGSLRRQGFREQEMNSYYADAVGRLLDFRQPVMLYHHPNNRHEHVLRYTIDLARQRGLNFMRMIDYARWWNRRVSFAADPGLRDSMLTLNTEPAVEDCWYRITTRGNRECFSPAQGTVDLRRLEWKPVPLPASLPDDIVRIRRFNPWIPMNRLEDSIHRLLFPRS